MDYAEFRLVVSPDLTTLGQWSIILQACPVSDLEGHKGTLTPTFTRGDLNMLRDRSGWPDNVRLRQVGEKVWTSILPAEAAAAYAASRQLVYTHRHSSVGMSQQGLRFVVVMQGQEKALDRSVASLSELPVEAIYDPVNRHLATNVGTPISRSFQWEPDRTAERVILPLRVLVAIASPSDKPRANIAEEQTAIQAAVQTLTDKRDLEIKFLPQATRSDVHRELSRHSYHIFHFIGHGGFDATVMDNRVTRRPHLCFVRKGSTQSDPTGADTLSIMLTNSSVRLVVITACSSAAPSSVSTSFLDAGPLGVGAFDGIAQSIVAGTSGVTAAVAMQLDLEDIAAPHFSGVFYENLMRPGMALDEVVARARQELAVLLDVGHRAWVAPVVYWRCQGGKVFDIHPRVRELDATSLEELRGIDGQIAVWRESLALYIAEPIELREKAIAKIEALRDRRADLFGESLRISGERVRAGQTANCRLKLRMDRPGTIWQISFRVNYPEDRLSFEGSGSGDDVRSSPTYSPQGRGSLSVVLVDPSDEKLWDRGQYDVGVLRFKVTEDAAPGLINIYLSSLLVLRDGERSGEFWPGDGLLVVF